MDNQEQKRQDDYWVKGYTKVTFTRKQHKKLFPVRKKTLWTRYEYYINQDELVLEWHHTLLLKVVYTTAFPLVILVYGVYKIEEILKEYSDLYSSKPCAKDGVPFTTSLYKEATSILQQEGQI